MDNHTPVFTDCLRGAQVEQVRILVEHTGSISENAQRCLLATCAIERSRMAMMSSAVTMMSSGLPCSAIILLLWHSTEASLVGQPCAHSSCLFPNPAFVRRERTEMLPVKLV